MISAQPAIRVAVNDRQLPVLAIEDGGRVLVPFRAVVEALGGDISAFHLPLPPPAQVIAGRTYAPIRFLATQLHADIQYDARTRIVQVFTHQSAAAERLASIDPNRGPIAPQLPVPNTRIASAYPTISANLAVSPGSSISTLRMLLDNDDVTQDAHYAGTFVTYIPRDGLKPGAHNVSVSGVGTDGRAFHSSWSFETTTAPAPDVAADIASPMYGLNAIQLNVGGDQFVGGSPISVQMTAPPGGQAFAFVCTSAWHFPLLAAPLSNFYYASIPTTSVGAAINCPITAMYIARDGTVMYAPYPVFVQLLPPRTPSPAAAAPKPTRVPLPAPTRRTPNPVPTTAPTPVPVPRTTPIPAPRSTQEPDPRTGVPKVRPRPTPPQ
jgi:hypothetical protein